MILELEEHVEAALKGTRKFYVPIFGYINFKAKALMEKKQGWKWDQGWS